MKERGLLLYVCFNLLVASDSRMGFKSGLTTRFSLVDMVTRQEAADYWKAYIRRRTMEILDKYYDFEKSDFWLSPGGKMKMVGDKRVVAADWVYKKYGILNPRPTFTRIGDLYRIECPPEWKPDVIFVPVDFKRIRVPLKVTMSMRIERLLTPMLQSMPLMSILMTQSGSVKGSHKRLEDFTEILNVQDHGVAGDGVTDDTNALETLFTDEAGRCLFFPRGTYNVDQYASRIRGSYNDHVGPQVLANTTIVGEGDGTLFDAQANALWIFLIGGNNVTIKDVKFTGTGIAGAGDLSSGAIYAQNVDNMNIINATSNDMIGPGGVNSRGFSIVGSQVGSLLQDSRMDNNEHGVVTGAPNPCQGVRIISCYSNDAVEFNYYWEGPHLGSILMSSVSNGTGNGCYVVYGVDSKGGNFSGNSFLSAGNGIQPYQAVTYTHFHTTWSHNICQTGVNGAYPMCAKSVFTGNIFTNCAQDGFYAFTRFEHNTVSGNIMSLNTRYGLHVQNDSHYNHFIGNLIIDNSGGTGVWLRSGNYNRFVQNKIYSSNTGSYHTAKGLEITASTHTYLEGNDLRNAGAVVYSDATTDTIWAGGNLTEQW